MNPTLKLLAGIQVAGVGRHAATLSPAKVQAYLKASLLRHYICHVLRYWYNSLLGLLRGRIPSNHSASDCQILNPVPSSSHFHYSPIPENSEDPSSHCVGLVAIILVVICTHLHTSRVKLGSNQATPLWQREGSPSCITCSMGCDRLCDIDSSFVRHQDIAAFTRRQNRAECIISHRRRVSCTNN